jgi:5-methylcytosine-specific restriction endonuclease McrA
MKKRPPFNENAAIRGAIRRTFSRSPVVREVLMEGRREVPKYNKDGTRSKKDSVQYQCQTCGEWVSSTKVAVDHIVPVISVDEGFAGWDVFVSRLFCDKSNLARICEPCHQLKSNRERFERQYKVDLQMVAELEANPDPAAVKKGLAKFSNKRLGLYPQDFVSRVLALKALGKKKR